MPRVKGLTERFTFISMVEGYPKKDWADFNQEDQQRLKELRNTLLKWRLTTRQEQLPNVELPIKGRLKELWKPIIQITSGLTIENDLRNQLEQIQKERQNEKTNTLEGHIVKIVCQLYTPNQPTPSNAIWDELTKDLEGKQDDKKPNKMDTPEFGEVTKQKIGYRLREVLDSQRVKVRGQEGTVSAHQFDPEKLKRIAKKYSCNFVPKFPTQPTSTPAQATKPKTDPTHTNIAPQNPPTTENKTNETKFETTKSSPKVGNPGTSLTLEELASKTKELTRLTINFGVEPCGCCGVQGRADWQATFFDQSWRFLCGLCGNKLAGRISQR